MVISSFHPDIEDIILPTRPQRNRRLRRTEKPRVGVGGKNRPHPI
jgi:hypothetical protein